MIEHARRAVLVTCVLVGAASCERRSPANEPVGPATTSAATSATTSAAAGGAASSHALALPAAALAPASAPATSNATGTPMALDAGTAGAKRSGETGVAEADVVRFAVIGDFGDGSGNEAAVAQLVKSWRPAFVITTGDDNYPSGEAATIDSHIGAFYAEYIGNYRGRHGTGATSNRFWPTPGNHDWMTGRLGPYLDYFTLPGNERYYDVAIGRVHLFALDSDPQEPDGTTAESTQGRWTQDRLTASKACFNVVYFHHPPYSSGPHGESTFMRWPFRAWGADVVMAGHDHTYERFQVDGLPYIVNGLGGAERYPFRPEGAVRPVFRYNQKHGAMLVTATRDGITYQFWNVDGMKLDELTVPKHCGS